MRKGRDAAEDDLLPHVFDDFRWDRYPEIASRQRENLGEWRRIAQFLDHLHMAPSHNHDLDAHQRLNSTVATSQSCARTRSIISSLTDCPRTS